MDSAIGTIASVVAAAASLTAIALGLDQLTSGSRLRRIESALRDAHGMATGARAEILTSVHTSVVGQLLARHAIPARRFIPGVALSVMAWAQAAAHGFRIEQPLSWGEWPTIAAWALAGGMGVTMVVRLTIERARVNRCYQHGLTPIRAYSNMLSMMEGGGRGDLVASYMLSLGVTVTARIAAEGVAAGEMPRPSNMWGVVAFGLIAMSGAYIGRSVREPRVAEPRNRDNTLRPTWVHPTPLAAPAPAAESETPRPQEGQSTQKVTPGRRMWRWWKRR